MASLADRLDSDCDTCIYTKLTHELLSVELELVGVSSGEHGEGEGPSEEGGTEGDGTAGGVNLLSLTHIFSLVGGDDNVSVFNNTAEVLFIERIYAGERVMLNVSSSELGFAPQVLRARTLKLYDLLPSSFAIVWLVSPLTWSSRIPLSILLIMRAGLMKRIHERITSQ